MEIFKKMGPRVILVEHRGRVTGLVTVKDCLKYQFKVEAEEQALAATQQAELPLGVYQNAKDTDTLEERIWNFMRNIGSKFSKMSGRRPRDVRPIPQEDRSPSTILAGTEDDDADDGMVELEERH
jgi:chloride channel 3/4/5